MLLAFVTIMVACNSNRSECESGPDWIYNPPVDNSSFLCIVESAPASMQHVACRQAEVLAMQRLAQRANGKVEVIQKIFQDEVCGEDTENCYYYYDEAFSEAKRTIISHGSIGVAVDETHYLLASSGIIPVMY